VTVATLRVGPCEFSGTAAELADLWRHMGSPGAEPLPADRVEDLRVFVRTEDFAPADRSTIPDGRAAPAGTAR
jgi:hypothetical protein